MGRTVTVPVIDSGSILVSRPDSTDSIRAAEPLVALNDSSKPAAVPMPNAWQDSDQVMRLDSLDSMLVREIEKTGKR